METQLPEVNVTATLLFTIAGLLLSVLGSYIPGFNTWFAKKSKEFKQLLMLIAILVVAVVIAVLSFTGVWVLIAPTKNGVIMLVLYVLMAIVSNQGVYSITPAARSVKQVKDETELARLVALSAGSARQE